MTTQFIIYEAYMNMETRKVSGYGNYGGNLYTFWGTRSKGFHTKQVNSIAIANRIMNQKASSSKYKVMFSNRKSDKSLRKELTSLLLLQVISGEN